MIYFKELLHDKFSLDNKTDLVFVSKCSPLNVKSIFSLNLLIMALPLMKFQDQGYKIRKNFA